jgi:uncharacterized protein with WD repeat
MEHKIAALL